MPPALTAEEVSRTFSVGRPDERQALAGVSFEVAAGEVLAIMGRSGSGKSTLLNVCGLLDRPSSGRLLLEGVDTASLQERALNRTRAERIGFVFQRHHLFEHRPVRESVALPVLYGSRAIGRRDVGALVEEALEMVDMHWAADRAAALLSGGERQRVAVARALVTRPALLLCDEPTGQLDEANATLVVRAIAGAASLGSAVVIVTHDPQVAAAGDRVLRLADGRVVA